MRRTVALALLLVATTVRLKPDTTAVMTTIRLKPDITAAIATGVVSGFSRTVIAQAAPKQAVVDTSAGTFVIDLTPEAAPNTTAYFMKLAADGGYDGTTFHRV